MNVGREDGRTTKNQTQPKKVPFSAKFAEKVEQAEQGLRSLTEDDWHDSDSEEDDWCGMYEEGVDGETFC